MSSLPPALDFPRMEEEICERWKREGTFKMQDKLSKDRNDDVRSYCEGMHYLFEALITNFISPRFSLFTTVRLSRRVCPITGTSWPVPSRTLSLDTPV
jgi:hypothetical protein